MVGLNDIKSQLKDLSRYGSGLVAVFVGGTSGIGETTAREFVRYTTKPRVYIVGRSQEAADKLVPEFKKINPESHVEFIKSDVALLKNVDEVCTQIKAKEEKINLLCLSAGIMTMEGRNETPEGLDKKFSLHYYSRLRFTQQLLPLLSKAASNPSEPSKQPLSRVISVLGAGHEWAINTDDFDLKSTYSLKNCASHAQSGNTLFLSHLAADPANKGITFIHSAPGGVMTSIFRNLPKYAQYGVRGLLLVLKPFNIMVGFQESGERHVYATTSDEFGKGGYVGLNPSSDVVKSSAVVEKMLSDGTEEKVWDFTQNVFKKVCEEGEKF